MKTPYTGKVKNKQTGEVYKILAIEAEMTRRWGQYVYQVLPADIPIRFMNPDNVEYVWHSDVVEV